MLVETLIAASLSFESPTPKVLRTYYPPIHYDYPFPGRLIVQWMEPTEVIRYCPRMGIACVIEIRTGDYCLIAANEEWFHRRDDILRHENGHCNSWPPDHPR